MEPYVNLFLTMDNDQLASMWDDYLLFNRKGYINKRCAFESVLAHYRDMFKLPIIRFEQDYLYECALRFVRIKREEAQTTVSKNLYFLYNRKKDKAILKLKETLGLTMQYFNKNRSCAYGSPRLLMTIQGRSITVLIYDGNDKELIDMLSDALS